MFRRKKPSPAEQLAQMLGGPVHGPVNDIHPAPTQRRLVESLITRPSGLVAILESVSQCSQLIPPGALGNPEPVEVPISGHNLVLTLINRSDRTITVTALRAVYTSVTEYDFPAQLCAFPQAPDLSYDDGLTQATEHARDGFQHLQKPHLEVHFSGHRPLIAEALLPSGERAREPARLSVRAGQAEEIVLSPVLSRRDCVGWRLVIRWREIGDDLYSSWDLMATGFVGWTACSPNGEVRPRPLDRFGHWDPVSLWQDGCTSYDEHLGMIATPDQAWLDAVRRD